MIFLKIESSLYTAEVESVSNLRCSNPPIFHLKTNAQMTGRPLRDPVNCGQPLPEVLLNPAERCIEEGVASRVHIPAQCHLWR